MSALQADRNTIKRGASAINELNSLPVAASTVLYNGSLVAKNSSGYAVPASADNTLKVYGVAEKRYDNSSGAAGAINADIRAGVFRLANGDSITAADIGKPCYASDDQTVNKSSSNGVRPFAGVIAGVDSSGVFVEIRPTASAPAKYPKAFVSAELTGTGSSQDVAHGLGVVPAAVFVAPTELAADLAAGYDVAEGTHTTTNVVVTVTTGAKFKILAFAA